MKRQSILTTNRLRLREMIEEDLDFIAQMLADPEVIQYYPKTYSREEAALWLDRQFIRYREDGNGLSKIFRPEKLSGRLA